MCRKPLGVTPTMLTSSKSPLNDTVTTVAFPLTSLGGDPSNALRDTCVKEFECELFFNGFSDKIIATTINVHDVK